MGLETGPQIIDSLMGDKRVRLSLADGSDFLRWSWGTIESIEDLYSPQIFGSSKDLTCECGKLAGLSRVGEHCFDCNTVVFGDVSLPRRRLMAVIKFPTALAHPLGDSYADRWPVAPIAYRVDADGKPNALGRKYERLFEFMAGLAPRFEGLDAIELMDAWQAATRPTHCLLLDIIGTARLQQSPDDEPGSTLIEILVPLLLSAAPEAPVILKSMGLTIDIAARA